MPTRLLLLLALAAFAHPQAPESATVKIGILSLFHPKILILSSPEPLTLTLDHGTFSLPANQTATLESTPGGLVISSASLLPEETVQTLTTPQATFTLTVPHKLTRLYRGSLTVGVTSDTLLAVVEMPTELVVASIVQAESPPHASLEALKAQAVVSRSFLLAQPGRHREFDACDTTHCQFLRSPPPARNPASIATRATRNLVLTWRADPESLPKIVAAMYSRSCGGHTRAHPTTPTAYPFYSVTCDFCLRHPELWRRPRPSGRAPETERQRLAYNRAHGWSAIPSNSYRAYPGELGELAGRGTGHGIGLCQLGANDMASRGASFQKILEHFFPNTTISSLK